MDHVPIPGEHDLPIHLSQSRSADDLRGRQPPPGQHAIQRRPPVTQLQRMRSCKAGRGGVSLFAAVVHSHDYGPLDQFRRTFDEWRALHDVHGFVQPLAPLNTLLALQSNVRKDVRAGSGPVRSLRHWSVRTLGAALGSRADRLPERARGWCSLDARA